MSHCQNCQKPIIYQNHLGQLLKPGDCGYFKRSHCNRHCERAAKLKAGQLPDECKQQGTPVYCDALVETQSGKVLEMSIGANLYAEDRLVSGEFKTRVFQCIGQPDNFKQQHYPDVADWYKTLEEAS